MRSFSHFFLIIMCLSVCSPAWADNNFAIGAGWFDFNRNQDNSFNVSAEWRGNHFFYGLRPVIGAAINTDGGIYGYGGFDYDWEIIPHWFIIPGLDIGGWRKGNSIDLGGVFEFHESIELDYKFINNNRVGVQLTHTSNASIHAGNPGVNTLMAVIAFPL